MSANKLLDVFSGQRGRNQDGRVIEKEDSGARFIDELRDRLLFPAFRPDQIPFV